MAKKIQFSDLNRRIEILDDASVSIETVWAKVSYHNNFQIAKTNVVFTVRARTDVLPSWKIIWDGNDYVVQNVAQVSIDYTAIECDIPASMKA
ncbi:MAG: head-tail adaptor protein [Bacteroidetes bacterium]|nr:head-tail adaptor protein [Bacteroidota bacterium]